MSKYVIEFEGEIIDECDTLKEADEVITEKIHDIYSLGDEYYIYKKVMTYSSEVEINVVKEK